MARQVGWVKWARRWQRAELAWNGFFQEMLEDRQRLVSCLHPRLQVLVLYSAIYGMLSPTGAAGRGFHRGSDHVMTDIAGAPYFRLDHNLLWLHCTFTSCIATCPLLLALS